MRFIILFTLLISSHFVNAAEYLCSNMKEQYDDIQLSEIKDYLASDFVDTGRPSKAILAASIGDINYIKRQKSFNTLFEAFYLTLSSDMLIFQDLLNLLEEYDINQRSIEGVTLLMMAVDCGKISAVKTFIEKGANVNLKVENHGADALNMAVMTRNEDMVRYLISQGSNCKDSIYKNGVTVEELSKKIANSNISNLISNCIKNR
ncbi:ankyrin repeat domain-containing protein [Thalassotalea piscium]